MPTMTVPVVPWSRKEEEAKLRKFVDGLQEGSYLRMLLSDQLIAWFVDKMADDFSTDLYAIYHEEMNDHSQLVKHLNYEIEQLKQENTDYAISIDLIAKERDDLRTAKVKVEGRMYEYKNDSCKYERLVQGIREIISLVKPE